MTLDYFGDWIKVIDKEELFKVMNTISKLYKTKSICPDKNLVFKAFTM